MNKEAHFVAEKIRLMDEQIKFLEFAWGRSTSAERGLVINDYSGKVPHKYTGN